MTDRQQIPYRLGLLFFLFLCCTGVPAQDAALRQLSATPLLTNPALTGVMDDELRFTANYREAYTALVTRDGYRNVAAAAEGRKRVGKYNYAGFGMLLQHDRAGSSDYTRTQGVLSGSYQQRLGGSGPGGKYGSFLSGGVQIGFGQRGFDLNKIWYSEQYFVDPVSREAYLDRSLPTGEPFSGNGSQVYLDVSAGVAYFASLGNRSGLHLGLATYHLSEPNISPVPDSPDRLYRRFVLHGGGELPLGRGYMSLLPGFRLMRQGPSFSGLVGGSLRYTERQWREIALRVGSYAQLADGTDDGLSIGTLVVLVGLEMEDLQLGLSYEIATGGLGRVANSRGGFEISLVYTRPSGTAQPVKCPTF